MVDSIYHKYRDDKKVQEELLREIRDLAIGADLPSRNVTIYLQPGRGKDDAELCADRYAGRMINNPKLREKLEYGIRLSELGDPDYKGFLTENGQTGVLTQRASRLVRGEFIVVQGKVNRREKHEKRVNAHFGSTANETNSRSSPDSQLPLQVDAPIDRTMRVHELDSQNCRPLLDLRNIYGVTVLELLVVKSFTARLPQPPDARTLKNEARRIRRQRTAEVRKRQPKLGG